MAEPFPELAPPVVEDDVVDNDDDVLLFLMENLNLFRAFVEIVELMLFPIIIDERLMDNNNNNVVYIILRKAKVWYLEEVDKNVKSG